MEKASSKVKSRCKTGWKIEKNDDTGRWEALHGGEGDVTLIDFGSFSSAVQFVVRKTMHEYHPIPYVLNAVYVPVFNTWVQHDSEYIQGYMGSWHGMG